MTISARATDVRSRILPGLVGMRATTSPLDQIQTVANSSPQAKESKTLTVSGSAATGTVYAFLLMGFALSYTRVAGDASDTAVAAKIADVINADLRVRGQVSASASGAVVTITALLPGMAFDLSESDANLAVATVVSAAAAEAVPFGRLVCASSHDSEGSILGFLAKSAQFAAQVDSYALTYDDGVNAIVRVEVDGETHEAIVTMATDMDTAGAAIAAALNAVLPPDTVLAAYVAASDTLTLTAEVAGKPFKSSIAFGPGADTAAASKTSTAGIGTDLNLAAAGVALHGYDEESAAYPANAGVRALKSGLVWVANTQAPELGDPVYVELAAGSDAGKFYNSGSSTRVRLAKARWERPAREAADGIALLTIDL